MSITSTGKSVWLQCICREEDIPMADLEETLSATQFAEGRYALGQTARFKTEWGDCTARYVKNKSGRRMLMGQVGKIRRDTVMASNAGADNTTALKVGGRDYFFTSNGDIAGPNDWAEAAVYASAAGNAAPEGQGARVIANTSATISRFQLDRQFSTTVDRSDTFALIHRGQYVNATLGEDYTILDVGLWAANCATDYYGWVVMEGVHPRGDFAGDVPLSSHVRVGATMSRLVVAASEAPANRLPFQPLMPVDYATTTRHWPVQVRGSALMVAGYTA